MFLLVGKAAVKVHVHFGVGVCIFISLGQAPRRGVDVSETCHGRVLVPVLQSHWLRLGEWVGGDVGRPPVAVASSRAGGENARG